MGAFLGILVLLVGLLLVVLATPVSLEFELTLDGAFRAHWRFAWLYGMLITSGSTTRRGWSRPRRTTGSTARSRSNTRRHAPGRFVALIRTRGFAAAVFRLVGDVMTLFCPRQLYVNGSFGFADPADTGMVYGALSPLLVAATSRGFDVRCHPDFVKQGVRGVCGGRLSVRPATLVWAGGRFLSSLPTLRALYTLWMTRTRGASRR